MTSDRTSSHAPQKPPRSTEGAGAPSSGAFPAEGFVQERAPAEGTTTDVQGAAETHASGIENGLANVPSGPPPGFIRQYELVDLVKSYDPQADEALLNRGYVFAMQAHGDQKRSSGDPYFTHPLAVASILTELKLDPATITTALLHDVVEDTDVTIEEIEATFGGEVARMVDGVTKISKRELAPDADGKAENFVKFVMATAKDVRVLLVKLADRLHNMRTLHFISKPEKRERISRETMEIYAPLAGRIGVHRIKEELEDLSFRYLNPDAHDAITEGLKSLSQRAVSDVVALAQVLRDALDSAGIKADVSSREKRAFSVWRKMQRKRITFEELADIYAFRVLVEDAADCYRALGVIHQSFPMIPDEFDDYISTPKPNGYQSIHTAVLASDDDRDGQRVEIQIRSRMMHDIAERGVAAHWRYKDASARQKGGDTVELSAQGPHGTYDWLRGVIDMLQAGDNATAFLDQAKIDLYQDQVFPFTPRGRVIPLPKGATPLDFAYALHTEVGDRYAGAKINGVARPHRTPLRNGDVVEVLKSEQAPIPTGWEGFVVTGAAKHGLRRRIKELKRKDQRALGDRIVSSAFAARDLPMSAKGLKEAAHKLSYKSADAVLEAVGRMDISGQAVLEAVFPNLDIASNDQGDTAVGPGVALPRGMVSLDGMTLGAAAQLAPCCAPLPGERVVGLRDPAGGIVVHRIDCATLAHAQDAEWLNLSWTAGDQAHFVAYIEVTVNNRTGALGHIGTMLARYGADIVDLTLKHREVEFSELWFDIAVRDARHLSNVLTGLRASDYVVAAVRRDEQEADMDEMTNGYL